MARTPPPPPLLSLDQQRRWLTEHIPHRIRAVLPGIPMVGKWQIAWDARIETQRIVWRCMGNSMWEGRMSAMRWLIEFIGIQERAGGPIETQLRVSTDMRIDAIQGGVLFSPARTEAIHLAQVWKGCSQATSHPTQSTNHPDVSEKPLASALLIVIEHLEATIYKTNNVSLHAITLTAV